MVPRVSARARKKVEQNGKWPQQACTTILQKSGTSERPIALVGSSEGTISGGMATEVSCGLGRYRWPKLRSSTNSLGNLDGDGEVQIPSRRRRCGSSGLGVGLGDGTRAGQSPVVGLGNALQLRKKDFANAVRVF